MVTAAQVWSTIREARETIAQAQRTLDESRRQRERLERLVAFLRESQARGQVGGGELSRALDGFRDRSLIEKAPRPAA